MLLGTMMACGWMWLGAVILGAATTPAASSALLAVVYAAYFGGSALFIWRKMSRWAGSES